MKRFDNPLDNIRIASPCATDWNAMRGSERRRFCSQCSLNVYNLSEMTQSEAENFLINSEGRVCLKIFRRQDGTIITNDCPVGWQKIKRRAARLSAGVFALVMSFMSGLAGFKVFSRPFNAQNYVKPVETGKENGPKISFGLYGTTSNLPEIKLEILRSRNR